MCVYVLLILYVKYIRISSVLGGCVDIHQTVGTVVRDRKSVCLEFRRALVLRTSRTVRLISRFCLRFRWTFGRENEAVIVHMEFQKTMFSSFSQNFLGTKTRDDLPCFGCCFEILLVMMTDSFYRLFGYYHTLLLCMLEVCSFKQPPVS